MNRIRIYRIMTSVMKQYGNKNQMCLECESTEIVYDARGGQFICTECGMVLEDRIPDEGDEGTNYENDSGVRKDLTRHGYTDGFNPHDTLGTYIPRGTFITITKPDGTTYRKDLSKLNMMVSQTSKEKSYNNIVKIFDELLLNRSVHKSVVNKAKHIWAEITIVNTTIYRGSNLKGILASCVLYSSYGTENPLDRDRVCNLMRYTKKDISNGEPIFRTLVKKTKYRDLLNYSTNNRSEKMFTKIISELGLEYSVVGKCIVMYQTVKLKSLKEKSIIAGIVWENSHMVKGITKKMVSEKTGVTIPTLNKAHETLVKKMSKE